MKCGECGGTMRYAQVTLDERFGGVRFVIEGIPALVCDRCGTREVSAPLLEAFEETAAQLEREVAKLKFSERPLELAGRVSEG